MITLLAKPIDLPWAFATRPGFKGYAPGNFFRHFKTQAEAEVSAAYRDRKKLYCGPIEYRPRECYQVGEVAL